MHYWNRDNFEGLKSIGEKFSLIEGYELFGSYCIHKESGFKKLANLAVDEFVSVAKMKSADKQREIAVELASLSFWNGKIHQLLTYPLVKYLIGVLDLWASDEPECSLPHKWLGYLTRDISYYERALQLDPNDDICLSQIVQANLSDLDYQTHHLSESLFLGDPSDAKNSVATTKALIARLNIDSVRASLGEELAYYVNLVGRWEEYKSSTQDSSFPDWCTSHGHKFKFCSIVYYGK